jgi:hypothetical protein
MKGKGFLTNGAKMQRRRPVCRNVEDSSVISDSMILFESEIMRLFFAVLISTLIFPSATFAKSCAAMTKELEQLRREYQTYAKSPSARSGAVTFEQLVGILDKIVELKGAMRKSNCKVPTRTTPLQKKAN